MKKHLLSTYGEFQEYELSTNYNAIFLGVTSETRSSEASDPDEFVLQGPTNLTFIQESTDADEFCVDILKDSNDSDFDDILLM